MSNRVQNENNLDPHGEPGNNGSDRLKQDMQDHWPSPLVTRAQIAQFSGGILHPRDLANKDSKGEGIWPRYRYKQTEGFLSNCGCGSVYR